MRRVLCLMNGGTRMKLQKIKRVCVNEGVALVREGLGPTSAAGLTGDAERLNMVQQWVGIPGALYAVEGVRVTPGVLAAVWDLSEKQKGDIEWLEDADEGWLRQLPSQIDEEAPRLGIVQIGSYSFFRQREDEERQEAAIGVRDDYLAPVRACEGPKQYMVCGNRAGDLWLICYVKGQLCAAIRAGSDATMISCVAVARELAERGVVIQTELA